MVPQHIFQHHRCITMRLHRTRIMGRNEQAGWSGSRLSYLHQRREFSHLLSTSAGVHIRHRTDLKDRAEMEICSRNAWLPSLCFQCILQHQVRQYVVSDVGLCHTGCICWTILAYRGRYCAGLSREAKAWQVSRLLAC